MCGMPDLYEEMNLVHTIKVSDNMRIRRSAGKWADLVGRQERSTWNLLCVDGKKNGADGQSTAESASSGESESPAADSEREDSRLTQRMWTAVDSTGSTHNGRTNAMLIGRIAGIWADLVGHDELDKAQQLLVTVSEHPDVDKEILRGALLDTVRQTVRGAPRRTESHDNSGNEVLSDPLPKLASKRGKTRRRRTRVAEARPCCTLGSCCPEDLSLKCRLLRVSDPRPHWHQSPYR